MDDLPIFTRHPAASPRIAVHTAIPLLCPLGLNVAHGRGRNVGLDHSSNPRADQSCA